jgi:hypothetical protein
MITIATPVGCVVVTRIGQDTEHSVAWSLRGPARVLRQLLPGLLPNAHSAYESAVLAQITVVAHKHLVVVKMRKGPGCHR